MASPTGKKQWFTPNVVRVDGNAAYILLTGRKTTFEVIVDIADAEKIITFTRWQNNRGRTTNYASGYVWQEGKKASVQLHRFILDVPEGMQVDHINGNGLDCRRSNLRIVTSGENNQNRHIALGISGFKNVIWHAQKQKWRVSVLLSGKQYYGGHFHNLGDATRSAVELRKRLHSHCPENSREAQAHGRS